LVRVTELSSGLRLLIGRDLEERRRLFGIVASAAQWSVLIVVVLGLGGGVFVARRVLRRIDAMTGTTQRIMAAICRDGCRSAAAVMSSTGWRKTSMPCWSGSKP